MIQPHLPALIVIIPLLAALISALMPRGKLAWGVATLACVGSFASAFAVLLLVEGGGVVTYAMDGWAPPIGIEYRIDQVNAFVLLLVSGIAAVMMPFAYASVGHEVAGEKQSSFYSLVLLCVAGLLGIVATNDIFNIYVFLEISSLAMYALIAMGDSRRALTAAFEYLILGTIGATFILIGVGLLYMMTGTLNISDMAVRLADVPDTRPVEAAFAFLTLGLALEIATFPLHIWLTNAYAYAPSFVSALLAATAAKVSFYLLLRFALGLFGPAFSFEAMPLEEIVVVLGVAGVVVGSLVAVFQEDVKRRLAFSSVAQLGYMLLGFGLATVLGLSAATLHLFNHALAKGALFLALGCVYYRIGSVRLSDMAGIGKQMPWTLMAFVIGGLSIIGVPGTAGFISKWFFLKALLEGPYWPLVVVVLLSSLLAVIYIWQVVEQAVFASRPKGARAVREAPWSMQLSLWALVIANIYFGLDTRFTIGWAERIAGYLLGAG